MLETGDHHQPEQRVGERHDAVEADLEAAGEAVVLPVPSGAGVAVEGEEDGLEPDHAGQPAQEPVALRQT